ncbi:MAG: hypothetical protein P8Y36_10140, partial [Alphaproteobacteria bacterium]
TQWITREVDNALSHHADYYDFSGIIEVFVSVTPFLSLVPAVMVAVIGELAHIRSVLYYIVAGGASAEAIPFIAMVPDNNGMLYSATYFSIIATSGFVGGFVYWLIAGRNA